MVDRRSDLRVDRTLSWVDRSVVPSLATIVVCCGDVGHRMLRDWIRSAIPHLSPRHQAAIRQFRYAYREGMYAATGDEVA